MKGAQVYLSSSGCLVKHRDRFFCMSQKIDLQLRTIRSYTANSSQQMPFLKGPLTMITTLLATPISAPATSIITDPHLTNTLDQAAIGDLFSVRKVQAPNAAPEWGRLLEELGFIEGEHVTLMARALPGGDPLVVRVGQSTFALRRAEAACVQVGVPAKAKVSWSGQ